MPAQSIKSYVFQASRYGLLALLLVMLGQCDQRLTLTRKYISDLTTTQQAKQLQQLSLDCLTTTKYFILNTLPEKIQTITSELVKETSYLISSGTQDTTSHQQ